ncbi:MAG: hypothetical protein ACYTGX_11070 [Planctomycetota bacterium]
MITPTTTRPLEVPLGTTLEYVIDGPLGMVDHPESKRQLPRPKSLTLTGSAGGTQFSMVQLPTPAGQKPPVIVPGELRGTLDRFGMVRTATSPAHTPHKGGEDHNADPAIGERLYQMLATALLMRPNAAEPGSKHWKDVAWFSYGPEDQFGGLLHVSREGEQTLGGRTCERFRWRLETGVPHHFLGRITILEANGLTFYDPAAKAVAAAELEFRFSDRPTAWRFQPWSWMRIALPDVNYTGSELDGQWIDPAFTLEQQERADDFEQKVAEDTAIKRLAGIARGQRRFIEQVVLDLNGNGVGEPGFLGELSAASNLRTEGAVVGPKVTIHKGGFTDFGMHTVDGKTSAKGVGGNKSYRIQMWIRTKNGFVTEGLLPPPGAAADAAASEGKGGWHCLMWPADGSPGKLVLYVDGSMADGEVWGTYGLEQARGLDGSPGAMPDGKRNGVEWKLRKQSERVPPPEYHVRILADNVDVPKSTYGLLARMSAAFIRLQIPDLFTTLPKGSDGLVRELEHRWREAWRDRKVSRDELEPIVSQFEAVLQGKFVPGLVPIGLEKPPVQQGGGDGSGDGSK